MCGVHVFPNFEAKEHFLFDHGFMIACLRLCSSSCWAMLWQILEQHLLTDGLPYANLFCSLRMFFWRNLEGSLGCAFSRTLRSHPPCRSAVLDDARSLLPDHLSNSVSFVKRLLFRCDRSFLVSVHIAFLISVGQYFTIRGIVFVQLTASRVLVVIRGRVVS